jgi:exodeoxyribonuclease V gamma subunit
MQAVIPGTPRPPGLPPRIVVFGIPALPLQSVRALAELGRVCQVLVVVQNPCRYHWAHVVEDRHLLRQLDRQRQRPRPDIDLRTEAPALLASWGRQGRDTLHLLDEFDETETRRHLLPRTEVFTDPLEGPSGASRLACLQSVILNLEPPPEAPLDIDHDDSLRFVHTHSPQREVEVLHDQLLAWLDADPTLSPRDIMVMVPDMAGFVSHVRAVFGRYAPGHPCHLPYSVADTSPRALPLVQALERLLQLPESRITFADWLALFEVGAVRRRFDLSESDVAALRDWLDAAGVRWGLDGAHRIAQGLPPGFADLEQNSWAAGLRRLLLGYAQAEDGPWQDVLPVAGIGGLGAQRIGALADWLDVMAATLDSLRAARRPADWVTAFSAVLDRFFTPDGEADERLLHRLREALGDWLALCDAAQLDEPVSRVVVREHWLSQVETPGLAQRFFGGGVQFATLMPMRSIPFRVVCVLGMNDGDYPRPSTPRDFDLMTTSWRPGDRSRREDDRYLFLEALLSAREKFYVSWVGRRVTDNTELPPSVVVGQLHDEVARRFAPPPVIEAQPLQPFSRQYFDPADMRFSTYDADWQSPGDGALAIRVAGEGGAARALPEALTIAELQRLLRQPVEVFWRSRLGVWLDEPDAALPEDEPFELDRLEEHVIGSAFIDALRVHGEADAVRRLKLSGALPLAAAGARSLADLVSTAKVVLRHAAGWLVDAVPRSVPVALDLGAGGLQLQDAVNGLHDRSGELLQLVLRPGAVTHERDHRRLPRHHVALAAWVNHVCLAAAGHAVTTVVCGADAALEIPALSRDDATRILAGWVGLWREAWTQPLKLPCRTALEFLAPNAADHEAARLAFEGDGRRPGERAYSAYLARSIDAYEDVSIALDRCAQPLYGDLVARLRLAGAFA